MKVKKFADKILITDEWAEDLNVVQTVLKEMNKKNISDKITWELIKDCEFGQVVKLFHVKHSKKGGKK